MADNVAVTAGSGTTIAADDVGSGVLHQRVKVTWGVDGTGTDTSLTNPLPVEIVPNGGGGTSLYYKSSTADNNAAAVKASAGKVYSITAFNSNTAVRYLKFYNKASAPNPASDTVVACVSLFGSSGGVIPLANAWKFTTGIAIAMVTGAADTNNSSVLADEIKVTIGYV